MNNRANGSRWQTQSQDRASRRSIIAAGLLVSLVLFHLIVLPIPEYTELKSDLGSCPRRQSLDHTTYAENAEIGEIQ